METITLEQFEAMRAEIKGELKPLIGKPITFDKKLWRIDDFSIEDGSIKIDCTYYDGRNFIEGEGSIIEFELDDLIENIRVSIPKVIALNEAERAGLNNE